MIFDLSAILSFHTFLMNTHVKDFHTLPNMTFIGVLQEVGTSHLPSPPELFQYTVRLMTLVSLYFFSFLLDLVYMVLLMYLSSSLLIYIFNDTLPFVLVVVNDAMNGFTSNDWYIGNVMQYGYYRVNYPEDNWSKLIKQLKTNHTVSVGLICPYLSYLCTCYYSQFLSTCCLFTFHIFHPAGVVLSLTYSPFPF